MSYKIKSWTDGPYNNREIEVLLSLKKPVEIMVHDLPVAFITVHHYGDDNTLLWTTSQISARCPVLRDVEIPVLTID
jgi:hypothetical protein